jgi:hypothetical protein
LSPEVLRHSFPHGEKPETQLNPQAESTQVAVPLGGFPQATPQPEQFAASVLVSTHRPPQFTAVPPHEAPQRPPEQTSPAAHGLSHAPQFAGSESTSTHCWPHFTKPVSHVKPQIAPVQVALPCAGTVQRVPHVPQFSGSVAVFVHELPHRS